MPYLCGFREGGLFFVDKNTLTVVCAGPRESSRRRESSGTYGRKSTRNSRNTAPLRKKAHLPLCA